VLDITITEVVKLVNDVLSNSIEVFLMWIRVPRSTPKIISTTNYFILIFLDRFFDLEDFFSGTSMSLLKAEVISLTVVNC
jgi:hypothetical protein